MVDSNPAPPAAPAATGTVELALPTDHWGWVLASAVFGGLATGAAATLTWYGALRVLGLHSNVIFAAPIGLGAVLGAITAAFWTFIVLKLLGVPRARVTWDEDAITEWIGAKARTVISRDTARVALLTTKVQMVRGSRAVTGPLHGGRTLQFSDERGQTITLSEGEFRPAWLRNHPCRVQSIDPLAALVTQQAPRGVVPNDRAYGRAASLIFGLIAVLAYAAFVGGIFAANGHAFDAEAQGNALLLLGAFLFGIRALWPATRLLRARPGGRLSAGVEVMLRLGVVLMLATPAVMAIASSVR